MDQIKIGKFISLRRKDLNLTQQQLADLLHISNKTISKWETGKGMPEIGLLLPLCNELKISVNELLSGENLDNKYQEKAEENLIALFKEKEKLRLKKKTQSLVILFSFIMTILCWFLLFADSNIYQMGHIPTPLTLAYLMIGFILIFLVIFVMNSFIVHFLASH